MQQRGAEAAAARLGVPVDVDPLDALVQSLSRAWGAMLFWEAQVAELHPGWIGDIDSGRITRRGVIGSDHLGDGAPDIAVRMYNEAIERSARIAKLALDAGVAERQIHLAEEQAHQLANMLRAMLTELGVAITDPAVMQVVRKHLTLLAGETIVDVEVVDDATEAR